MSLQCERARVLKVIKPQRGVPRTLKIVTKAEREHTPPELAAWLVEVARRCRVGAAAIARATGTDGATP